MPKIVHIDNIRFDRQLLLNLTRLFDRENGTCLFYSGGNFEVAKQSFLCLFPYDFISIKGPVWKRASLQSSYNIDLKGENPWEAIKESLPSFTHGSSYPEWVGFFSYEMGAFSDPQKRFPYYPSSIPDAYLQRPSIVIVVDHEKETGTVVIADQAYYLLSGEQLEWVRRLSNKDHWKELASHLSTFFWNAESNPSSGELRSHETREEYIGKVEKAKELIRSGDIYQVNLSQKFTIASHPDPYVIFRKLVDLNPAPFSAYLCLNDATIVSSSPERFLKKKEGWLESRPIKGTIARGITMEEDKKNKELLMNSEKEKAELLMITDLMRNDLGKISLAGSVEVPHIQTCETYTNVFHLVSVIRSKVLPDLHPIDIIRACFPGGSITGCPKLSAIEVIADLEKRRRGIYTGSIGYISGDGDFDFNIAIRTIVHTENHIDIQLGGAIVADSDPIKEYEETLHKGASIFAALNCS